MAFYVCADFLRIQTTNLIINLDHDDWIFSDETKTLAESGFGACSLSILSLVRDVHPMLISLTENETEVSFFNREMYETFKLDPQVFVPTPPPRMLPHRIVISLLPRRHVGKADLFSGVHSSGTFGGYQCVLYPRNVTMERDLYGRATAVAS